MNICICTTPIRPTPTTYPPFGSMAIIQSLRKIGEYAKFYNIDYFRYNHDQVEEYFRKNRFDIVGISAAVSTAYNRSVTTVMRCRSDTRRTTFSYFSRQLFAGNQHRVRYSNCFNLVPGNDPGGFLFLVTGINSIGWG